MKKLLFLPLFLLCCSNTFNYQNVNVYNLSFTIKDPYTLSTLSDKTTIKHKDTVVSVIKLDKDPQSANAYVNAVVTRLKDKDINVSVIESKVNKNGIKYVYFTSSDGEVNVQYAFIKKPNEDGYVLTCTKRDLDQDNLCDVVIDSLKIK